MNLTHGHFLDAMGFGNMSDALRFIEQTSIITQKHTRKSIWIGGHPKAPCDWNLPQNWHNNEVPGWESEVIIRANRSGYYPIISEPSTDIHFLRIGFNAKLSIQRGGQLTVDGLFRKSRSLEVMGVLFNGGELNLIGNKDLSVTLRGMLFNEGVLGIDRPIEKMLTSESVAHLHNWGEIDKLYF